MTKVDLEQQVIVATRAYGISTVLFRNAVGDRLGVNVTDMECLGLLFFKGIATPTELSQHTGLSSGATTALLDRLEAAGLITRRQNPADRRGSLIAVDKIAKRTVGPLFASAREAQNKLIAGYTEKELATLLDFFQKFTALYEAERAKLPHTAQSGRQTKRFSGILKRK